MLSRGAVGRRAQIHQKRYRPTLYARALVTVAVAELAVEIGFVLSHYAAPAYEREEHQQHQQPKIAENDGQAI